MTPPEVIRVLGRDIPITFVDELPRAFGEYDYLTQIVRIRTGQQPAFEADTLLHELIHAIDDVMFLGMKERQVHCVASGMIAVLKDNPEFLDYLRHAIRTKRNSRR
jgi:hypothetical protein